MTRTDKPVSPMLADNKHYIADLNELVEIGHLANPMFASYKMDGIRAFVENGVVLSRTRKPIPSAFVQRTFGALEGCDGELTCGSPCGPTLYQDTYSAVMTHASSVPVEFRVFDLWNVLEDYDQRYQILSDIVEDETEHVQLVDQIRCSTPLDIEKAENEALALGYEGLILRRLTGPYKFGRSTWKEGYLLKLKRFQDAEARIVGFEELMHNANEAGTDERGYTKRTSHKANLVGMDTLGALVCEGINGPFKGVGFKIGTFKNYSKDQLRVLWLIREQLKGQLVRYSYQQCGTKDAPRHPRIDQEKVMMGFRDPMDM